MSIAPDETANNAPKKNKDQLGTELGRRPKILYAEDVTTARIITTELLRQIGCDVDAVEHGEEALGRATHDHYDLVLLDIEMPIMDGVTAARKIRALGGVYDKTPIMALSAFLADTIGHAEIIDVFDKSLLKPAGRKELKQALGELLCDQTERTTRHYLEPEKSLITLENLKAGLPGQTWRQLVLTASAELLHYTAAIGAAAQANDTETVRRAAFALWRLACSFSATELAEAANKLKNAPTSIAHRQHLHILISLSTQAANNLQKML